jgi:hypothetical protein
LPERTRLARLFKTHQHWATRFLTEPTILSFTDSFGIELCHPMRQMHFPDRQRIGKKGKSNSRWIVSGKLCVVLNKTKQIALLIEWLKAISCISVEGYEREDFADFCAGSLA